MITESVFTQVSLQDFSDLLFEPKIVSSLVKISKIVGVVNGASGVTGYASKGVQFVFVFLSLFGRAHQFKLNQHLAVV